MRMSNKLLITCFTLIFLSACGSKNVKEPQGLINDQEGVASESDNGGALAIGSDGSTIEGGIIDGSVDASVGQAITAEGQFLAHIIYFDLDQSTIKSEYLESLNGHATYLIQNPKILVRLGGHTDERGTREYNIALGERRGNSVKRYLMLQGVSENSIDVVSYGEERPVNDGHDETYWSENRRVEIHYENK